MAAVGNLEASGQGHNKGARVDEVAGKVDFRARECGVKIDDNFGPAVDGEDFKELEGVFDEEWVERLESMVMNKAVRYSDEEIEEIQELYATINNLL